MDRAFTLHRHPADWARVQRHAMQLRFDWKVAAQAYRALYEQTAATPGTAYASSLTGSR
jgi:glycogen synthase